MSAYRREARVSLRYRLELEDVEAAARRSMARERQGQGYLLTLLLALALTAAELYLRQSLLSLGLLAVGLLLMLRAYRQNKSRAAQAYDRLAEHSRLQEWELREDGLLLRDEQAETRRSWDSVLDWEETETGFLLFIPDSAYHLLPRRAFQDEEELAFLRRQLTEQVSSKGQPSEGRARVDAELGAHRFWTFGVHAAALLFCATVLELFLGRG